VRKQFLVDAKDTGAFTFGIDLIKVWN